MPARQSEGGGRRTPNTSWTAGRGVAFVCVARFSRYYNKPQCQLVTRSKHNARCVKQTSFGILPPNSHPTLACTASVTSAGSRFKLDDSPFPVERPACSA